MLDACLRKNASLAIRTKDVTTFINYLTIRSRSVDILFRVELLRFLEPSPCVAMCLVRSLARKGVVVRVRADMLT